jgi:hypothetical protein
VKNLSQASLAVWLFQTDFNFPKRKKPKYQAEAKRRAKKHHTGWSGILGRRTERTTTPDFPSFPFPLPLSNVQLDHQRRILYARRFTRLQQTARSRPATMATLSPVQTVVQHLAADLSAAAAKQLC